MLGGLPLCSERGVQREREEVRTQRAYVLIQLGQHMDSRQIDFVRC